VGYVDVRVCCLLVSALCIGVKWDCLHVLRWTSCEERVRLVPERERCLGAGESEIGGKNSLVEGSIDY
jgi:hypothetical protein